MRILSNVVCVFLIVLTACDSSKSDVEYQYLNSNWQFSESNDTLWMPANVPGTVQADLLSLGKIPDPFKQNYEDSIQWVSAKNWQYIKLFSVPDEALKKTKHYLKFEGLDTYASVYFNDSLILQANNAFRSWEIDISDVLKTENELLIQFQSPDSIEIAEAAKLDYELPEAPRVFTRKPQFQYGWDWGPTIKTMGIWKNVKLTSYDIARCTDVFLQTKSVSDTLAEITAQLTIETAEYNEITVELTNKTTNEKWVSSFEISPSQPVYEIPFTIKNPKLWWTHNLGDPFMYDIDIALKQGRKKLESYSKKLGIRTIELITDKDAIGESFYFKLNGKPVYMKGANYIPQQIMHPEVVQEHYVKLIDDVVSANMNMLRVWGGGIYEDSFFYQLCDAKGVLVWQDFMFACAMYPGDAAFLENAKQEAIENVKRLRNHPSIALWCGNNENSEGWHRWGWKDGKTEGEKQEIWNGDYALFNHILPRVVDSLNPAINYWGELSKVWSRRRAI
jgi:Beta-galactosidase/beta-glucuronidase